MARACELCGKGPQIGNQVTIRGKKKYLGGVGTKVTGITKRQFKPNLQRVKVSGEGGNAAHLRVCVQCIRSGAVVKKVRSAPFQLPVKPVKAAAGKSAAKGAKAAAPKAAGAKK
jgi:large subunit ribosomal protein L28